MSGDTILMTAHVNLMAISDEGRAKLSKLWPEWHEHVRIVRVETELRIPTRHVAHMRINPLPHLVRQLRARLGREIARSIEPVITRQDILP